MGEDNAIERSKRPATPTSLAEELRDVGLGDGMTVMVHSSLSRLGFVAGGAQSVVAALLDVVGPDGTLMMPTHSSQLSDPAQWQAPPVPESWWATIQDGMPAFDPHLTPSRSMGAIVECFRHVPGTVRSAHPTVSATAVGPRADELVHGHTFDDGLSESSPQARLYQLDGHILLLGVTHTNNTSLHLSENRGAPRGAARQSNTAPVTIDGVRTLVTYTELSDETDDFDKIGAEFAKSGLQRTGPVGAGTALFMRARDIVDFGADWMRANRDWEMTEPR